MAKPVGEYTHPTWWNYFLEKEFMKKSISLLILGLGIAIGAIAAQFLPHSASAQPLSSTADAGPSDLQALVGKPVLVNLHDGSLPGKLLSLSDGWIALDTGSLMNKEQPVVHIPLGAVSYIASAK
jgi:hypothetical protein